MFYFLCRVKNKDRKFLKSSEIYVVQLRFTETNICIKSLLFVKFTVVNFHMDFYHFSHQGWALRDEGARQGWRIGRNTVCKTALPAWGSSSPWSQGIAITLDISGQMLDSFSWDIVVAFLPSTSSILFNSTVESGVGPRLFCIALHSLNHDDFLLAQSNRKKSI